MFYTKIDILNNLKKEDCNEKNYDWSTFKNNIEYTKIIDLISYNFKDNLKELIYIISSIIENEKKDSLIYTYVTC